MKWKTRQKIRDGSQYLYHTESTPRLPKKSKEPLLLSEPLTIADLEWREDSFWKGCANRLFICDDIKSVKLSHNTFYFVYIDGQSHYFCTSVLKKIWDINQEDRSYNRFWKNENDITGEWGILYQCLTREYYED